MKTVVIVGGGLAGISAAKALEDNGFSPILIEKNPYLGGRVHTEELEGYLLDEGFQVLLSSYPEVSSSLKKSLELSSYSTGAHFKIGQSWKTVSNPFADPFTVRNWPKGTLRGILALLWKLGRDPGDRTTCEWIDQLSCHKDWKEAFLKPFLRGVFLDPSLSVRATRFRELMLFFLTGNACLPKKGMQELPRRLAQSLKTTQVRLETEVVGITPDTAPVSCSKRSRSSWVIKP